MKTIIMILPQIISGVLSNKIIKKKFRLFYEQMQGRKHQVFDYIKAIKKEHLKKADETIKKN